MMPECPTCYAVLDDGALSSGYCSRCGLLIDVDAAIERADAMWSIGDARM